MRYDISGRTQQMNQQDELLPSGGGAPTPIAATSRNVLYAYAMGRRHQAQSIGTTSYQYDRNGNQLTEQRSGAKLRYFDWDEEDRLLAVRDDTTTAEFRYDAGGTRTHKTSASSTTVYPSAFVTVRNGTEVTRHIYAAGERGPSRRTGNTLCRWTPKKLVGESMNAARAWQPKGRPEAVKVYNE